MNTRFHWREFACAAVIAFPTIQAPAQTNSSFDIDLPTALRLAGAQNVDVQIARQRVREAQANVTSAQWQFLPWLSPGVAYRRHDNYLQDVAGNIFEVHKQSYAPGATLAAQVDLGDAWYRTLETKRLAQAAAYRFEAQRQEALLAAARGYYELVQAQALVDVALESIAISSNQYAQVIQAVEAGLAFKGDQFRVEAQTLRDRLAWRQRVEKQRVASARLAQALRLDPAVELKAVTAELVPLELLGTNATLGTLISQGLAARPELKNNEALFEAARKSREGATYGPLIPRLDAQAFVGGLGGGIDGGSSTFGEQEDYYVGLSWKIGPGGLFDAGRTRARQARLESAALESTKTRDEIARQVVEAFARWQSARDQVQTARAAMRAAEQTLLLSGERKSFGVGAVLENIQAEQDLTAARNELVRRIAELNVAQYTLLRASGRLQ